MPLTTGLCIIGAASISAFPLLSGFVTKSLILNETSAAHHTVVYLMLLFASAGVFHHSGIKIPFFAFFSHDSGKRVKEAPLCMLVAMVTMAAGCIIIGIFPRLLYSILPYSVEYEPYTTTHVITQLQILLFSALAFTVLKRTGIYPPELRSTNLDFDWAYRRAIPVAVSAAVRVGGAAQRHLLTLTKKALGSVYRGIYHLHGPEGVFARTWTTGAIAFWAVLGLGFYLLLYLL
jgi:multicomponent Na+:H+ antiporter subunit D